MDTDETLTRSRFTVGDVLFSTTIPAHAPRNSVSSPSGTNTYSSA